VAVQEEQEVGESELGGDIEDTVSDNLGIDRDLVGSLRKGKDDGVSGPEDEGHSAEESVKSLGLAASVLGSLDTVKDEDPPDVEEEDARHGVESPSSSLTIGPSSGHNGREQSSDDHENVSKDGEDSVVWAETGEETQRNKQERSGEQPIDGSGVVELSQESVFAGFGVVVVDRSEGLAETGSHGKVGNHSDSEDQSGAPVEESSSLLDSLREDEDTDETDSEEGKDDPEGSVSDMGRVDELGDGDGESASGQGQFMVTVVTVGTGSSWRVDRDGTRRVGVRGVVVVVAVCDEQKRDREDACFEHSEERSVGIERGFLARVLR